MRLCQVLYGRRTFCQPRNNRAAGWIGQGPEKRIKHEVGLVRHKANYHENTQISKLTDRVNCSINC